MTEDLQNISPMVKVLSIALILTLLTIFNTTLFLSYRESFNNDVKSYDRFARCVEYFDGTQHCNYTARLCDKYKYRYTVHSLDKSLYIATYYMTNMIVAFIVIIVSAV